ncbi:MAG: heavy metal translocating P-type ATPase, partial [Phycisphaerae bacterium]
PVGTATLDAREVIRLAASAEQYAQHPFARAIVAQAREWNIQLAEPTTFSNVPARGVAARIDDRDILVGGSGLLRERGVDISLVASRLERVVMDGQSAVLLAVDGACAGLIGISDRIRTEASRAIEGLSQLGVATAMVTGDQAVTATAVAGAIGVGDVHAEMSPEDKCALVQARRDQGQCVAFVGDGINDAPALATADVGITFASATDVAAGAADVTILHDDLMRLPDVVLLARRSVRVIKQNLFWAFFYNVVAIPAAMLGKVTPGVAAAAMMCSSISVVLNSLRLRRTHHAGGATESHAASHGAQASS